MIDKKEIILVLLLFVLFVGVRLFGIDLPYHQDETKYVTIATSSNVTEFSSHPPLTMGVLYLMGNMFHESYFRLMPLLFSVLSVIALYVLVRILIGPTAALWSGFLYAISPYGVWASLMIDTDGAILPFFVLSAFLSYSLFWLYPNRKILFGIFCALFLFLGIMVKLSFVLVFATLGIDLAIRLWQDGRRRAFWITTIAVFVTPIMLLGVLMLLTTIFPLFNMTIMLGHVMDFLHISGRNYFQIAYQLFKAVLYLSPLLIVPILFISRNIFRKLRLFWLYMLLAAIFYLVIFDFSSSALDKYLMVAVIPFATLSGAALAQRRGSTSIPEDAEPLRTWRWLGAGLIAVAFLVLVQAFPHAVPSLYPKGEWIRRIFELRWNFLVPFMGGSGPLGFYSSWLFLGVSWLLMIGAVLFGLIRKKLMMVKPFVVVVGIAYCVIMLSDMLFGYPHGNSKKVLDDALSYIERTPTVQSVITFNDTGGYYLGKLGKYKRRMFAVPKYEESYKEILSEHDGHVLVVDIPRIYQNSVYWRYISSCRPEFTSRSGYISATLYDCKEHMEL